jgi:hypothetical protein
MKRAIVVGLAVLVNAGLFGLLEWNANVHHQPPPGEVHITELDAEHPDTYARLFDETRA